MTKINKTNAARILDQQHIEYKLIPYEVNLDDLSATHIASQLNEPIEQVFKTLVLRGDKNGIFVCVIPGGDELDLKTAARISGNKKCDLIAVKELLPLTGYIRGGCSPIGMKKAYPTFIDQSCMNFEYIYVSAGIRGLQLLLSPNNLIAATKAIPAKLIMNTPAQ